ncbi:hypothetical protein GOP47_0027769 [Adiantum capillus-veneris]|nr:hypothetical protein GOP47_0027769 [Adiantum capillus-veneris]
MTNSYGHATPDSNGALVEKDITAPTQAVKVAVHVRPLIAIERLQGCKDCVTITPGQPQVQIGNCSYTYDHVYGSTATPSERIFEECVVPLVDGLFNGYNATVLAYGQTGSGKTYTMGTGDTVGGSNDGIIPKVMELLYKKMEQTSEKVVYQVRVSFIEILNEELHDLLVSNALTATRPDMYVGANMRPITPSKSSIQIRETIGGEITLSGVTEIEVSSLHQMATLLEQGSLSRATASTNMNSTSSRSHAILTITIQQGRKFDVLSNNGMLDNFHDDCLCAKLHLVDLAGSERVKRTGTDGMRFKEGVHINKGLLALGNVISALGDEKKRKDGGHVPYRDSKLTRLLQDSLGGNSRTVMIACISPADSNAEESLNTLKYANRARNIQNKPLVNRDPMVAEMQRLRQQLELLQAELLCFRAGGGSPEDTHMLNQKISWLEASNSGLRQELQQAREGLQFCAQRVLDVLIERDGLRHRIDLLRSGKSWEEVNGLDGHQTSCLNESVELLHAYTTKIHELESNIHCIEHAKSQNFAPFLPSPYTRCVNSQITHIGDYMDLPEVHGGNVGFIPSGLEEDEAVAKELEHTRLQVSMDKELQELNERLQQKEAEMTLMVKVENTELKQQFEKKLMEHEEEKRTLQMERDKLLREVKNLSCVSDEQTQKMQVAYSDKLKDLESQLAELKQNQDNQTLFFKQKIHNDDAEKHLLEEIQRIKSQKVQLQHRIKQESEYFRCWKAAHEKELMQLRKEGRRNEHEMLKLQALNQRQKMVLQRKTEEAALATRRLKDILEARKSSAREITAGSNANGSFKHMSQKALQQSVDHDLEVAVHIHEVRFNYEKQAELRASLAGELEKLQQEGDIVPVSLQKDYRTMDSMSFATNPDARQVRAELLKTMLDTSSNALVAMASELSEAEERERVCSGPGRWQNLRTMGDAKALLNHIFNNAVDTRCQLSDLHRENKELKENIGKLKEMLKQSEAHRREAHRQQQLAEHAIAKAITTSTQVGVDMSRVRGVDEVSLSFLHSRSLDSGECFPSYNQSDMLSISSGGSQYGFRKINARGGRVKHSHPQMGKLLRWKRSHERWLLQFKWKWQKPWRLSEWIRHGDESFITRARPSRMLHAAEFQ